MLKEFVGMLLVSLGIELIMVGRRESEKDAVPPPSAAE